MVGPVGELRTGVFGAVLDFHQLFGQQIGHVEIIQSLLDGTEAVPAHVYQ
jgi:hypothetical protein